MATIQPRKNKDGTTSYRVGVARKGYPRQTETFATRAEAKAWAADIESKMFRGTAPKVVAQKRTVRDLLSTYKNEVTKNKRAAVGEAQRLDRFDRLLPFRDKLVGDVSTHDIVLWCNALATEPSAKTGKPLKQGTLHREV